MSMTDVSHPHLERDLRAMTADGVTFSVMVALGETYVPAFALANEEYGLEILKVREIIGYIDVTAIPQMPHHVKGVINLRGQVIPVVDLRGKFGMTSNQTAVGVLDLNSMRLAMMHPDRE